MFEISRILAPVVFSENCRGAVHYAVGLASRFGAEVTVLHVLEPLKMLDFDTSVGLDYLDKCRRESVSRQLDDLTHGLRSQAPIADACVQGDPASEIVRVAESLDASLIVIATHGYGPFRRFLLGSVTAKVLHDANCPVWTGAHLDKALAIETAPGDFRVVLCAVDFGPQTEAALEWSSGLAQAYNANLMLLHVLGPARHDEKQRSAIEEAQSHLESRGASVEIPVQCHVTVGEVAEAVNATAERVNADLLVIGRGHLQGGGRLRSTSYAILRGSPCPVVSV